MGGEEEKCRVTVVGQVILSVHIISEGILSWPFVTSQRVNFTDGLFFFSYTSFNARKTAGVFAEASGHVGKYWSTFAQYEAFRAVFLNHCAAAH